MPRRGLGFLGASGVCVAWFITSCGGDPEIGMVVGGAAGSGGQSGSSANAAMGGRVVEFGGSTSVAGAGGEADTSCAKGSAEAEFVPANFLFVIDTSGSMNCNPPNGDEMLAARCRLFPVKENPDLPSKWEVTKSALLAALEGLSARSNVSAGLMLFPRATECGVSDEPDVPIAPLDEAQLGEMEAALSAVEPKGETPVAGATILSYAHIAKRLVEGSLTGNSFVVLLTDGVETCAPSALVPLVNEHVPNARGFDIQSFVIGAPGSEAARSLLSEVAFRGGTATDESCVHGGTDPAVGDCHFDMTGSRDFEAELVTGLSAISTNETVSCEIDVPRNSDGRGVDLTRVNVSFTPEDGEAEAIVNDDGPCDRASNGWQYSSDLTKIVVCGEACSGIRNRNGELEVVLGCPTIKVR